jgi:hypothetical protein
MYRTLICLALIAVACQSQSILDTVASRAYFNLDQIIDRADCIYIVRKAGPPFTSIKAVACDKLPPFHAIRYHFVIMETLKEASPARARDSIEVQDAFEELALTVHQTYCAKKRMIQPFVGFYRSPIALESADTLIVFLQRGGTEASSFVYALCVKHAWESVAKKGQIVAALARLRKPRPESKNPFVRFLTN